MSSPVLSVLLLVAAAAVVLPANAQSGRGDEAAKVTFKVTRFDVADRPPPEFELRGGGEPVTLEVPLTYIAGPFKATLRDGRFLDFFRPGAERPEISLPIPPAMRKDLLLVFVAGNDGFEVTMVHVPPSRMKGGDRYIINATDSRLSLQYRGAKAVVIPPGKADILAGPGRDEVTLVDVAVQQEQGEQWRVVSRETWPCDPRVRKFLIVFRSPRTKHITFHGVEELVGTPRE